MLVTYFGARRRAVCTAAASQDPSGDSRSAVTRGMRHVVVEMIEAGHGISSAGMSHGPYPAAFMLPPPASGQNG